LRGRNGLDVIFLKALVVEALSTVPFAHVIGQNQENVLNEVRKVLFRRFWCVGEASEDGDRLKVGLWLASLQDDPPPVPREDMFLVEGLRSFMASGSASLSRIDRTLRLAHCTGIPLPARITGGGVLRRLEDWSAGLTIARTNEVTAKEPAAIDITWALLDTFWNVYHQVDMFEETVAVRALIANAVEKLEEQELVMMLLGDRAQWKDGSLEVGDDIILATDETFLGQLADKGSTVNVDRLWNYDFPKQIPDGQEAKGETVEWMEPSPGEWLTALFPKELGVTWSKEAIHEIDRLMKFDLM